MAGPAGAEGKTGLRPQDLHDPANQQTLITEGLLAYALSGGQPFWASILPAGGVGNIAPAAPQNGAVPSLDRQLWQTLYGGQLTPAYQGSARFSTSGFALSRGLVHARERVLRSSQSGSGTGFFVLTLDYDTGRFSGRFGWRALQLNGASIADASGPVDSPARSQARKFWTAKSALWQMARQTGPGQSSLLLSVPSAIAHICWTASGFEMRVFDSQNQELARDSQDNFLDRDGTVTGDASCGAGHPGPVRHGLDER